MPVPLISHVVSEGFNKIPFVWTFIKIAPWIGILAALKYWFGGATNRSERVMHGKVIMVTGGTSGIGTEVVKGLASRGAQIILLTNHNPADLFLVDYIEDLRKSTDNELIYAEQVDLSSLHSIRLFATKWVDNAPPRRLDMIILLASTMTPSRGISITTIDGVEEEWMINYLSSFHLLSILSPAIRAQPPDRDVRVLFSSCPSYIGGTLAQLPETENPSKNGSKSYARTKLAVMVFVQAFQKHLDAYKRPDGQDTNTRAIIVDPGYCRTPGTRRWMTGGSLWGLAIYLLMWPVWWLVLKSPEQGAQTFLLAAMEAQLGAGPGGRFLKECREREIMRPEVKDEKVAKALWEFSEKQIERLEKAGALKRALAKKEAELAVGNGDQTSKTQVSTDKEGGNVNGKPRDEVKAGSRRSRKGKS